MARPLDLIPLTLQAVPDPSTPQFQQFVEDYFAMGQKVAESMSSWLHHSHKDHGTVEIVNLTSASSMLQIRKDLGVKEYWCGRISSHTPESVAAMARSSDGPVSSVKKHLTSHDNHKDNQPEVMSTGTTDNDLYERFRKGLLVDHSQHEKEYIEACKEAECLHVFQPTVAEVWRLTYVTPPPTNPRTFVVLLLCKELDSTPGQRRFMNISIPFSHPDCPEKQGAEKSRVRARYVSVERVKEMDGGARVDWRMATSSDAGGNIPRFMTNQSLPSSISEDVGSFLKWSIKQWPQSA